jgi:mannose-6-phosphate isomerase-like protein (cupin superfamily)
VYVPAEKRQEAVVKGVVTGGTNELIPRDMDLGLRASMGKKNATPPITEAEVHETFGHIYLIEEGSATLVLGGELVDPKVRGTEWRGPAIRGGQEFNVKKGDMITVQVGMPHQWKEVSAGGISYLAIHSFPDKPK